MKNRYRCIAFLALDYRNFDGEIGMLCHYTFLGTAAQFLVSAGVEVGAKVPLPIATESNKAVVACLASELLMFMSAILMGQMIIYRPLWWAGTCCGWLMELAVAF